LHRDKIPVLSLIEGYEKRFDMQLSPESKAIIDKLNESQTVFATKTTVGPFNQIAKDVLWIIIKNYEQLNRSSGESRIKEFLDYYKKLLADRTKPAEEKLDENIEKQRNRPAKCIFFLTLISV
jgi:hypothetical protein